MRGGILSGERNPLAHRPGLNPYCRVPQAHPDHGSCLAVSALPLHPPGELGPTPHPQTLALLPLPRKETEGQIVVSGDSGVAADGPFAVDLESGFLLVTRALDREEQAEYQLQASDGDAPGTANSDLRFHILNQAPPQPSADMFQLEPQLGALALSPEGSTSLDQALEGPYQLLVQVKDMGDQASGHQATATVDVSIVENTWVPLDPVHLAENLQVPYPHYIAQVHWSGGDVHYHLESQPLGPFDVDKEGKLYVTTELDREAQAEYLLQVRAQNTRGEDYAAEPLQLHVVVMDENDNVPVCPPRGPAISIPELSPPGTKVAELSVEDADAPGSPNSHIAYRLLSPEPEEGAEGRAFELDSTSGSVTLGAAPLQAGQNILLQVLVIDLGGAEGGLSSTCEIAVMITDINDHAPEFTASQIEPLSLPEDTEPGTLVTTLMATDADLEPAFRLMDFAIEAGDVEGTFGLDWEPSSDRVQLRLLKNLSYEAAPSHKLVVVVRSVAEPVGPDPGPGATVTVTVLVERVVPPLQLDQESYEASVPVSTPAGSLLLTIRPSDPMSSPLRFSLVNDSEGWLCIEEVSGEVHIARALQGAQPGDMYTVLVEAQDAVIVCRCNVEGQCMRKVGRMKGMPTKLSAVGILVGTLIAIGIFLILTFTHLTLTRKKDLDQPVDSVPLKAAV
ncbi:cadherin-16 isoform 1 [Pontoporia blainvillei]|uniref:Cadherin-16 isoform 1 n=1 Tax=Pontoporia blainvillei TaxID=48723 RepID=A0ABX0S6B1_PONBL|nr:cadherin-16 isoform 1 [Pontoporia blainvillei]